MLAAGRLEAELTHYLSKSGIEETLRKANLGTLIRTAKKHKLLSKLAPHLELLNEQRNYLAHNIYSLFYGFIEETILERTDLLDSDTHAFVEKAWQLAENLNDLADIVARYSKDM